MRSVSRRSFRPMCQGARVYSCGRVTSTALSGVAMRRSPVVAGGLNPLSRRGMASLTVKVPSMGDSITDGAVLSIEKSIGDFVKMDEEVIEIETDKTTVPVRAPEDGTLEEILVSEGDTVTVGQDLFKMKKGGSPSQGGDKKSQSVEKKADEKKVPAEERKAPKGAAPPPPPSPSKTASGPPAAASAPASAEEKASAVTQKVTPSVGEERVQMSRMRQKIAERLKGAQNTYAMLTTFQEVDMHELMLLREEHKDAFLKKHGVKLGFMSAFVKASTFALQQQPVINAVIDGTDIVYRHNVDISVAVATPRGLVVPVLRNTPDMSFADVEKTIAALGERARNNQLGLEDMAGGTFTISNGGVYGSLMGTPIINPPQSAILGMHAINKRAWVVGDEIKIRPIMYLALTYDHRLIDGREAVTFLRTVKHQIEDPRKMLLDL